MSDAVLHIESVPWIFLLQACLERKTKAVRMSTNKGVIGILTGGGMCRGSNQQSARSPFAACAKAIQVVGTRHGLAGRDQHPA